MNYCRYFLFLSDSASLSLPSTSHLSLPSTSHLSLSFSIQQTRRGKWRVDVVGSEARLGGGCKGALWRHSRGVGHRAVVSQWRGQAARSRAHARCGGEYGPGHGGAVLAGMRRGGRSARARAHPCGHAETRRDPHVAACPVRTRGATVVRAT